MSSSSSPSLSLWRESRSKPVDKSSQMLTFEFECWKKPVRSSGKRESESGGAFGITELPDSTLDLLTFKTSLCQDIEYSGDLAVTYVDSDGDEVPIDSECELQEALKYARAQNIKNKNVLLMIEQLGKQEIDEKSSPKQASSTPNCEGLFVIKEKSSPTTLRNNMAPIHMTNIVKSDRKQEETMKNSSSSLSLLSEAVPPVWFKNYMETLKSEIVKEVSTKVMADVMGVLSNGRPEFCPSSCSHALPRARHSRETNNEEKQHRKKKKRVVEEVESSDAFSPPQQPDVQLLRKVKKIEKREKNLRRKLDQKLEWLEQMTQIIVKTKNRCHDVAAIAKNLDKSCKLAEASAEAPVATAPLQGKQTEEYKAVSNVASSNEGRARMSCSVTGNNEMLEKPIGKEVPYESESDSDNISIISGISNVSDLDHDYNFEVIQTPACFILDKPLNNCGAENAKPNLRKGGNDTETLPIKESFNVLCEVENDRNNNRDSPSYEVLSGHASSASSIHLDEDHFHTSRNAPAETGQSDLIDLGNEDTSAKKRNAFVVDPKGKIFGKETGNETDQSNEIYFNKRAGGAYAFVNETLPSHAAKDASQMSKSETSCERSSAENSGLNSSMKSSHQSSGSKTETPAANVSQSIYESRADLGSKTSTESTQSFSSHISHSVGKNVYNYTEIEEKRTSYTGPKYTVVDKNVSKGLEETKYSSGENNLGARGCQSKREEQTNLDSGAKYQRGFTSESSACVFTEQPQKSAATEPEENGTRDSSPDFSRPRNDSVHILPETLVSGAVTVASSAYSTARRVLDRIRNMQTGEGNDHVENGVTLGSDVEGYFAMLEEMGFTNADLNARLLSQFNYDMSRVISELVQ